MLNVLPDHRIIILSALIFSACFQYNIIRKAEGGLIGLSLEDLSHQSELIISGTVLDEKPANDGLVNHSLSIQKIIKGNYTGSSISVFSQPEFVEDAVNLTKGEKVILFLYKERMYGGQYAVVGMLNGKYVIDPNGLVHGYDIPKPMTLADFEKNITDSVSK